MSDILTLKEKKEIKEIFPDIDEKTFVKKAIEEKIRAAKARNFFIISEKVRTGLNEKGYSPKDILKDFKS